MSRRTRVLGGLVLVVLWLHQVGIAVLSPLSERDWTVLIDGPVGPSLGAVWHWLIVHSQLAHVALTPLAIVALPLGVTALVRGGQPAAAWTGDDTASPDDGVVFLAVLATALWLAVPQFGLACSFRYAAASFLVPLSAAVWYLVALRRIVARRLASPGPVVGQIVGLVAAGIVAGASTPPIALATFAVGAAMVRRAPAPVRIAVLVALAIGAALAVITELEPIGLHLRLYDLDTAARAFSSQLRLCGWVGAMTAALWLGQTAYAAVRGQPARALPVAALDLIIRAIGLGCAIAVLGLATADFGAFQCIASGAAIGAVAATVIVAQVRGRRARIVLVILIVAVQGKMLSASLRTLDAAHAEYTLRQTLLGAAPPGSLAKLPPYRRRSRDFFFGEDFRTSARRDRVATMVFGLRGIELSPARRDVQDVPQLVVHHEVAGSAAGFPAFYSADLATTRDQFAAAVAAVRPTSARLVADQLTMPDRPGVPILAAWLDGRGRPAWWQLAQRRVDGAGQVRLVPVGPGLAGDDAAPELTAMWAFDLATGVGRPLARGDDGVFRLRPGQRGNAGLVACTQERCSLCEVVGLF